ncbi:hypothetical protein M8C21_033575 [Ambrosia artemisiifolia]|uniref:Uncharacterized protein n=1 Tax=Ambrosia artemisiifolia TaxID=4212 RepID=A0AAD5C8I6_AMBAR|nr:hypothetical protein M8C21_033575 [Ambrosia artemisiifolia]
MADFKSQPALLCSRLLRAAVQSPVLFYSAHCCIPGDNALLVRWWSAAAGPSRTAAAACKFKVKWVMQFDCFKMAETGKTEKEIDRALGTKEQRGHVRGMGRFVRPHQYFYLPNTVKHYMENEKKKYEERFKKLEDEMDKMRRGMNNVSEAGSCQMWGNEDFKDHSFEETVDNACYLAVDVPSNIVAKGIIMKDTFKEENVEVKVEIALQTEAEVPNPVVEEFVETVADAIGHVLSWPSYLVIRCSDLSLRLPLDEDVFGHESFTYVHWDDFEAVFSMNELSGGVISSYIMLLDTQIKSGQKRDHGICFANPTIISPADRKPKFQHNIEQASRVVVDRLLNRNGKDIILLPYNPGNHRVLAVLDMKGATCYYLDSLCPGSVFESLRKIIDMATTVYSAQTSTGKRFKLRWVNTKREGETCERQKMVLTPLQEWWLKVIKGGDKVFLEVAIGYCIIDSKSGRSDSCRGIWLPLLAWMLLIGKNYM